MEIREIHLDCQILSQEDRAKLLELGFFDDHFTSAGGGIELPPHHLTWQIEGNRSAILNHHREVLKKACDIVTQSPDFVGYVESEIIEPGFVTEIEPKPFSLLSPFPLPQTNQQCSDVNKLSDLHIKVPLSLLTAELEALFSEAKIYFVETPKRNRIYTLQFLSHKEGRVTFVTLSEFFKKCGGATELTYEICPMFLRKPENLSAPTVIVHGSLLTFFENNVHQLS